MDTKQEECYMIFWQIEHKLIGRMLVQLILV